MYTCELKQRTVALLAAAALGIATMMIGGPATGTGLPVDAMTIRGNPGVIPNVGPRYAELTEQWWRWAFSFPAASLPFLNTGGPVDISAGQPNLGVWFLAGDDGAHKVARAGVVPPGVQLFFPMANLVNDYPCPDPSFAPPPGESLEHFLQRTGVDVIYPQTGLFAEIDGVSLGNLSSYFVVSPIFTFTADPALAETFDPCITGTTQPGVSVGYWLLLAPLNPGVHVLHFGSHSWGQDVTYVLYVTPLGHGR